MDNINIDLDRDLDRELDSIYFTINYMMNKGFWIAIDEILNTIIRDMIDVNDPMTTELFNVDIAFGYMRATFPGKNKLFNRNIFIEECEYFMKKNDMWEKDLFKGLY